MPGGRERVHAELAREAAQPVTPEQECIDRARRRLAALFPGVSPGAWEPRTHGLWRSREGGSFFLRDVWRYVILRGDQWLAMEVQGELLDFAGLDVEAEIRAQADRTPGPAAAKVRNENPHFSKPGETAPAGYHTFPKEAGPS